MFSKIIVGLLLVFVSHFAFAQKTNPIIYGYKNGMALIMQPLEVKGKPKRKAIVSLVSGNWVSNISMLPAYSASSAIYADSGYAVFMVMHSSQPYYTIEDALSDVRRAIRYIRYNSRALGVDSLHIGITGSSSGGNVSLLAALTSDSIDVKAKDPVDRVSSRVQAAAVFYPPTDFFNWGRQNSGLYKMDLKNYGVAGAFDFKEMDPTTGRFERLTDTTSLIKKVKAISPILQVSSDDPPIFITHGDADQVVPLQQSTSIIKALENAKVPSKFVPHPGGGHGWTNSEVEKKQFIQWFNKWL